MLRRCQCEHQCHDVSDGCGSAADATETYDGTEIDLCAECLAAGHMGEPDDESVPA